jgi:hypothetical protein
VVSLFASVFHNFYELPKTMKSMTVLHFQQFLAIKNLSFSDRLRKSGVGNHYKSKSGNKWNFPVSVLQRRRKKVTGPDFKLEDGVPRVDFGDPPKTEMVPKSIFLWSVGTAGL